MNKTLKDTIIIDWYVLLTITIPDNHKKYTDINYYFFKNSNSIVEIKIDQETKIIMEIILIQISEIEDKKFTIRSTISDNIPMNSGNDYITENHHEFKFYKGDKQIFFILDNEDIDIVNKFSDHVTILMNKELEIVGIVFEDFNNKEWEELSGILKSKNLC